VSKKTDRKSNKTSGKSKKGGQTLEHTSILAIVETETENFPVKAVVPGKLICINQELVSSPQKLQTHTDSEGHIAIILPAKGQYESVKGYLVNSEDFEKLKI
jgi:glycine cleavage system H lipoate-binding protein